MTWIISKSGPKADVIEFVKAQPVSPAGFPMPDGESKAFDAFKAAILAQLEATEHPNVGVSASGSASSCSVSCSSWA